VQRNEALETSGPLLPQPIKIGGVGWNLTPAAAVVALEAAGTSEGAA
jgi:hypothetical protein